ncbi:hypothetical protein LY90DRAFT_516641 [Neocallimastix californiae]|uniref:Retrotransposon gag domain-containing protein n=1 Tax=Neocallimastix californiae TaxID=1754190 RepID=A0A1Y2AEC9_9FUNG|nr:hypothetical protein LY90DRAFT_516641 [Neocallimastix californiae]|eukprot:ORY20617.1 hypothetical protein LY90DRAFT_516641 [Neocallimastix californiae]
MEDMVMRDAYYAEYERDIPMFNGEKGDVESFIERLKSEPTAMLYFIEDHLQGIAKKWYQMDEVFKQRDDPQPQRLMDRLLKEFKSERTLKEVKTEMFKLRHEWDKAYEYLSEFNRFSRILQLSDETRRLLLVTTTKVFKIDIHDQQPKIFKIDDERPGLSDVDSPGECECDSIYMVQTPKDKEADEKKEIQPTARITKIINQVIDNQKLKDTVYDLQDNFTVKEE